MGIIENYVRKSYVIIIEVYGDKYYILKGSTGGHISGYTTDITRARRFRTINEALDFMNDITGRDFKFEIKPILIEFTLDSEDSLFKDEPIKSEDELRNDFLSCVRNMIDYWAPLDGDSSSNSTTISMSDCRDKVEGVVHSLLALIDGEAGDMPCYKLIPFSDKDDNAYRLGTGQKQIPNGIDIAGSLNDMIFNMDNITTAEVDLDD